MKDINSPTEIKFLDVLGMLIREEFGEALRNKDPNRVANILGGLSSALGKMIALVNEAKPEKAAESGLFDAAIKCIKEEVAKTKKEFVKFKDSLETKEGRAEIKEMLGKLANMIEKGERKSHQSLH